MHAIRRKKMSIAEMTVVIHKQPGAACGFTLVKDTCTVNRIVDQEASLDEQLRPGDLIIQINSIPVTGENVRQTLRNCREMTQVSVTISRSTFHQKRYQDQVRMLGIHSPPPPARNRGFFACLPRIFKFSNHKKAPPRRRSSSAGDHSPQGFGSVNSVSSTGMRPLDLRKLHKEGAATMWKASRESSLVPFN